MKYLLLEITTSVVEVFDGCECDAAPSIIGQYDQLEKVYEQAIDVATAERNAVESEYDDFDCTDDIDFISLAAFETLLLPNKPVSVCHFNGNYNSGECDIEHNYYVVKMEE